MAKSTARKIREKQAKQKGYDLISSLRGGQHIAIQTGTKMTKTKQSKLLQNKHKKRNVSEMDQSYCAFFDRIFFDNNRIYKFPRVTMDIF